MSQTILNGTVPNFTTSRSGNNWYTVTFDTSFPSGTTPVVFAQIQTYSGVDTPGIRIQKVSNTGFDVRMNEVVMNNTSSMIGSVSTNLGTVETSGVHPHAETLAWVAIAG